MWPTILGLLGPLLVQWVQGCGKDPVTAAKEAYDPSTDTFSEAAIRGGIIQTREAIQRAKHALPRQDPRRRQRFSREEIRAQTIAKMREGLTASAEAVASYAATAATLPEIDHDGDSDE